MDSAVAKARFNLTIHSFPADPIVPEVCQLIYGIKDKNLIATLVSVPYHVGRTFSWEESSFFHEQLKTLGVGHSLVSNDPSVQSMSYSPHHAPSKIDSGDGDKPRNKQFPNSLPLTEAKKWARFAIFAAACLAAYGVLHLSTRFGKKEQTGLKTASQHETTIEKLIDRVEYRLSQDLTWSEAKVNVGLDSGDAIRTFDESTAHLRYQEGSLVIVRPKTLMVIGKPEPSRQTISLEDGQVQARLRSSENSQTLRIKTPVGTLDMKSPKKGETAEARVDTSVSKGRIEVAVTSGKVSLTPATGDQKSIVLTSNQKIVGEINSLSPIVEFHPTVALFQPKNDETLTINPQENESLLFEWENISDDAQYIFEILPESTSKEPLLTRETREPKLILTYLDLGNLYWRVTAKTSSAVFISETRPLHVKKRNN